MLVSLIWIRAGYPRADLAHVLLHDAHEAYTGDIPAPVKHAIRAIERQRSGDDRAGSALGLLELVIDGRIREVLELPAADRSTLDRVKVCDLAALVVEAQLFGGPGCDCWGDVPAAMLTDVQRVVARCFPDFDRVVEARRGGR